MADSKITDLPFYDPLDVNSDDSLVIVDINKDQTNKITLADLSTVLKRYSFELNTGEMVTLANNLDSKSGISWVVNPQVFTQNYLPNSSITPCATIRTTRQKFVSPFKIRFQPIDCCDKKWPSLPYFTLKPGTPFPQYYSLMTLKYCNSIIATVTFSRSYINQPFIFIDEDGVEITHYNNGTRLRFTEGFIQL